MYLAADRGEITEAEAHLLVMTILSAGADTTVITMANAIRAFCQFPDQWQALKADPRRLRNAFDEALRWDSPSRLAGRIYAAAPKDGIYEVDVVATKPAGAGASAAAPIVIEHAWSGYPEGRLKGVKFISKTNEMVAMLPAQAPAKGVMSTAASPPAVIVRPISVWSTR